MPVGRWVWDKPMMVAPLLAVDLKACHNTDSWYQDVTGMSETYSVRRFRALPAKVLAGFVRSSLGG